MLNHIKHTIFTIVPTWAGVQAALEATDGAIKLLIGGITVVYLTIRTLSAWADYKAKKANK